MIRSMTGFGAAQAEAEGLRISVSMRSVNHRYLDLSVQLPRRLRELEPEVKSALQGRIERGRVDVSVQQLVLGGEPLASLAARERVGEVVATLCRLVAEHGLEGGVRLSDLLRFPGVVESVEPGPEAQESARPVLREALARAAGGLDDMRRTEGAFLASTLGLLLDAIESATVRLGEASAGARASRRETLVGRLRDLAAELGLEDARLYQEAARAAEKLDVTEEVERLRSHVSSARQLMAGDSAAGRRLDFLAQEMMREANTTGSKSADAGMIREVVSLKADVERFREQVQNVE